MDKISRIFINPTEHRLRTGWRLLGWIILTVLISTLIALAMQAITGRLQADIEGWLTWLSQIITDVVSVLSITGGVFLARRLLDRRSITSLGLCINRQAFRDLLAGFLMAGVIIFFMFTIERLAGWLTISQVGPGKDGAGRLLLGLGLMFLVYVGVGWQEELFTRGYLMQNPDNGLGFLGQRYSMSAAALLSSLLFGIAHLGNPNATWIGALGSSLAGAYLAYAYLASGQLWLPVGIHGWNFFEGPLLGFPISGMDSLAYLVQQTVNGPEMFTGGAFGPEAGLVVLPALVLGVVLGWVYTRKRAQAPARQGEENKAWVQLTRNTPPALWLNGWEQSVIFSPA